MSFDEPERASSTPVAAGRPTAQRTPPRAAILDLRGDQRPRTSDEGDEGPLAIVCGLPVVIRSLLVLERAGFAQAVLLADPADRDLVAALMERHPRLGLPCDICEDEGAALAPAVRALRDLPPDSEILYWPATLSFGRFPPEMPGPETRGQTILLERERSLSPGLLVTSMSVLATGAHLSVTGLAEQQARAGQLVRMPLVRQPVAVVGRAGVREAERRLLQSLRKDADGVVARFDRHLSLALSRRLMAFPVKPNQVTLLAALVGMICGLVVSLGGYGLMLLGALGFQLNSILDGVDGEIARAKLLESAGGQWFDTLSDDLSNLAFMIGVSIGSYRTWGSSSYLILGAISAAGFLLASVFMYHFLITRAHSGDLNDFAMPWEEGAQGKKDPRRQAEGPISRVIARIKWVARRDAYVFMCVLCGIVGQLRIMAWLFAAGTTVTWTTLFMYRGLIPWFHRRVRAVP